MKLQKEVEHGSGAPHVRVGAEVTLSLLSLLMHLRPETATSEVTSHLDKLDHISARPAVNPTIETAESPPCPCPEPRSPR